MTQKEVAEAVSVTGAILSGWWGGPSLVFTLSCCPPLHLIDSISTLLEIQTKTNHIRTIKISCDTLRVRQKDGGKVRQLYKYRTLNMAAVPPPPAARLSVL
jgi:hypothetical protein